MLNASQDGLELDIEGTRRESTAADAAPEHVVGTEAPAHEVVLR